jgi:hypothetical protein
VQVNFFKSLKGSTAGGQNPFPVGQTPFLVGQTCIEATFIDRFEPDLIRSFRMGKDF